MLHGPEFTTHRLHPHGVRALGSVPLGLSAVKGERCCNHTWHPAAAHSDAADQVITQVLGPADRGTFSIPCLSMQEPLPCDGQSLRKTALRSQQALRLSK